MYAIILVAFRLILYFMLTYSQKFYHEYGAAGFSILWVPALDYTASYLRSWYSAFAK
jgi:hypothetical protein